MVFPWRRHRDEALVAIERVEVVENQAALATARREEAEREQLRARDLTDALHRQVGLNHFTQLLQESWGRRGEVG